MVKYKELLDKCRSRGVIYSRMTIYRVGTKYGFIVKKDGNCNFNEKLFDEWLDEIADDLPDEYIYVCDATKKNNIPYSYFKYYFKKYDVEVKKRVNGLAYVRKSDVEKIVKRYNQKSVGKGDKEND